MTPFSARGGANFGMVNVTWPFAKLTASGEWLVLETTFFGSFEFHVSQVTAIEHYGLVPFLSSGIRIRHTVHRYPEKVVFWQIARPAWILRRIGESGFVPAGDPHSSAAAPRGFPLRWPPLIIAAVLWNALLLADGWRFGNGWHPGVWMITGLGLMFLFSLGALLTEPVQRIVLRPGRDFAEVSSWFGLIAAVTGIMLVILTAMALTGLDPNTVPLRR